MDCGSGRRLTGKRCEPGSRPRPARTGPVAGRVAPSANGLRSRELAHQKRLVLGLALATRITLALGTHAAAQAIPCWRRGGRRRSWAGVHRRFRLGRDACWQWLWRNERTPSAGSQRGWILRHGLPKPAHGMRPLARRSADGTLPGCRILLRQRRRALICSVRS